MQTVASFGQKGVLMEDEKPVRLLTEGGKKKGRGGNEWAEEGEVCSA